MAPIRFTAVEDNPDEIHRAEQRQNEGYGGSGCLALVGPEQYHQGHGYTCHRESALGHSPQHYAKPDGQPFGCSKIFHVSLFRYSGACDNLSDNLPDQRYDKQYAGEGHHERPGEGFQPEAVEMVYKAEIDEGYDPGHQK
jgi:hypothetical protein